MMLCTKNHYLFSVTSFNHAVPELDCVPLLGTNLLTISCFSFSGPIDTATCSIDGGPAYQCKLRNIQCPGIFLEFREEAQGFPTSEVDFPSQFVLNERY